MSDAHHEATRRLELAARITEAICELPAIATKSWAAEAAGRFQPFTSRALVSVTLGRVTAKGELRRVETTGAASAAGDQTVCAVYSRRLTRSESIGSALGDPEKWDEARTVVVMRVGSGFRRLRSAFAKTLRERDVGCALVAGARVPGVHADRALVLEIASLDPAATFGSADVAVIRAALVPLVHRALLAFGESGAEGARVLTSREQDVLARLARGRSVREIAIELKRSPHTVHDHVKSLHRKLNASSRGELIARALGRGDEEALAGPPPVIDESE